jgi:hypothetical protein
MQIPSVIIAIIIEESLRSAAVNDERVGRMLALGFIT